MPKAGYTNRAPASAAASATASTFSTLSSRKGSTGMSRIPVKIPSRDSSRTAASRRAGEGARGSIRAARASSVVVTVSLHSTGTWSLMHRSTSMSRVMRSLLVAMAAPKP